MSFFLVPRISSPDSFMRILGASEQDATQDMNSFAHRVKEYAEDGQVALKELDIFSASFQHFEITAVGPLENLEAVEEKIARSLAISRVPRASGSRCAFVDLAEGIIVVGTCVMFNASRACLGVTDASLEHKVELVDAVASLAAVSVKPATSSDLDRVSISLDGGPGIPLSTLLSTSSN